MARANQIDLYGYEQQHDHPSSHGIDPLPVDLIDGKIAVDIDDTIGDFMHDMRLALARRDGISLDEAKKRYPDNPMGSTGWFKDSETAYATYLDLEARGLLYHDQPVRAGAGAVLNWMATATDGGVWFLTARPAAFNAVTEHWLRTRVGYTGPIRIGNQHDKHNNPDFAVIIEDSAPNTTAITAEDAPHGPRKVIFMERPRTDGLFDENPHVHQAWSWSHVRSILTPTSDKE